jgi:hypothetical protein
MRFVADVYAPELIMPLLADSSNAQHQAFWNCQVPNIRDGCMNSGWRLKLGAAKLISVPALPGANNFNKEEPFSRSVVS